LTGRNIHFIVGPVMKLPRVKKDKGYHLRMFRAAHDLTQAQAAQLFGVSASHWSLMEDGKRTASPEIAAEMAKAMAVPIEIFLDVEVTR